ncbi:MAG: FecR family protein [Dongiaceae bacterium]
MSARPTHPRWRRGAQSLGLRPARCAAARRGSLAFVLVVAGLMCFGDARWVGSAHAADAAVGASPWTAERVQGNVRIRTAGEEARGWQPLDGAILIAGDGEVATGADGIAVLANGIDRIELSPNSHVVLPAPVEGPSLLTRIRQRLGRVFFDVGPRPERRFEVEAPFLVVLVKGTQFTVASNYIGNSVEVREGTVEARPAGGDGAGTLVTAGETASIRAGSNTLSVGPSGGGGGSGSSGQDGGNADPRSGESATRGSGPGSDGGAGGAGDGDGSGDGDGNNGGNGDGDGNGNGDGDGGGSGDGGDGDNDGGGGC